MRKKNNKGERDRHGGGREGLTPNACAQALTSVGEAHFWKSQCNLGQIMGDLSSRENGEGQHKKGK